MFLNRSHHNRTPAEMCARRTHGPVLCNSCEPRPVTIHKFTLAHNAGFLARWVSRPATPRLGKAPTWLTDPSTEFRAARRQNGDLSGVQNRLRLDELGIELWFTIFKQHLDNFREIAI